MQTRPEWTSSDIYDPAGLASNAALFHAALQLAATQPTTPGDETGSGGRRSRPSVLEGARVIRSQDL